MKDNFSSQAPRYRAFRPTYPPELYAFLFAQTPGRALAWDCGTGNGQVAAELARKFDRVYATDISSAQLREAPQADNITYALRAAQESGQADGSVDLITVGQALHWFDFEPFFGEVARVLRPGSGLFAAWGYQLLETDVPELTELMRHFYAAVVGPYWDPERRHIDQAYRDIPLPLREIDCPEFSIHLSWTPAALEGYLSTWTSVINYIGARSQNPVEGFMAQARPLMPETFGVRFPVFMRAGRV